MDILIAGAGQVGFRLAKALSLKNNVILMDQNQYAIERIQENVDVLTLVGNVEDPKSYELLENKKIDVFIAVTNSDETNLIASLIVAEKIDIKQKIIRLKKKFFAQSSIANKIGITDAVFPYTLPAQSILSFLSYPKANNIKRFVKTNHKLISIRVNNDIHGLTVQKINRDQVKVVGVATDHGKKLYIPQDDEAIQNGDMVYLFGNKEEIKKICQLLDNTKNRKIKNVVIFGADLLGIEIAKAFESYPEYNVTVKLVEKDLAKCESASAILKNNVTVINSKYGDFRLYDEEGLKNADMIIASTANDEENIIKCIEAKEQGVPKVIAVNNDLEYYSLMHALGVVMVRGPKLNAYYSIMEKIGSSEIVNERLFCGGAGILFIRHIEEESKTVYPLETPNVITFSVSDNIIEKFKSKRVIRSNTVLVAFALRDKEDEVKQWLNTL